MVERELINLTYNPSFEEVGEQLSGLILTALDEREEHINKMNSAKKASLQKEYNPKDDPFIKSFPKTGEYIVEVEGKKYKFKIEIEADFIVDLNEQSMKILDISEGIY